jgi:ribonuclease HI
MPASNQARVPCYFDGACPGNQLRGKGPMRAAFVAGETRIVREVPDLVTSAGPLRSNNIAEYQALILLLRHVDQLEKRAHARGAYLVCGDSQLVIRQMRGEYRVRNPHLTPLHAEASQLGSRLDVEFRWIPREKNPAGFLLEQSARGKTEKTRSRA